MSESQPSPAAPSAPPPPRRSFTEEVNREAVRLANERGNHSAVARDLEIVDRVLAHWKKCVEAGQAHPFPERGNPRDEELSKLQRENARLKAELEILVY
jgi:transposase-like protein